MLAAGLAPAYQSSRLLMDIQEAAGAATDVSLLAGRIAEDERVRRDISRDHRTGTDQGKGADGDATENDRPGTDGGSIAH